MPEIINYSGGYNLDFIMLPSEHIGQFNDFMKEYGELSDYEIYTKIAEVKGQVSKEVLNQHLQNLDALTNMNGFVTDTAKFRIEAVKKVLAEASSSNLQPRVDSNFFFGGSSLLLWFLILAAVWRRPFRGPTFGRPRFGFW